MGIIIECPKCGHWNAGSAQVCRGLIRSGSKKGNPCDVRNLRRLPAKEYLIEYRSSDGKKIRERVGPNKLDAEYRLQEMKNHIDDQAPKVQSSVTLSEIFDWYLGLPETKKKIAFRRIEARIKSLRRLLNAEGKVQELTVRQLELFVAQRTLEDSPMKKGEKIAPKTVKEELSLLKSIFKKAVEFGELPAVPIRGTSYPEIEVNNIRERIFSEEEFQRLLESTPQWLQRIIIMAQGTGMRQNEIIQLTWDSVDLERGFVRLKAKDTKTRTSRIVKLLPHVVKMLSEIPRVNHTRKVFLSALGKPLPYWTTYCHDTWKNALATAGITDACFHDLRHDFITKAIRKRTRPYIVMKQVGHKSDAMLRRYQLIDEDDLEMLEM